MHILKLANKLPAGLLWFLLVLVPFHLPLIQLTGSVEDLNLLRAWKEVVVTFLVVTSLVVYRDRLKLLLKQKVVKITLVFVAICLLYVSLGLATEPTAVLVGLRNNTIYLAVFVCALLIKTSRAQLNKLVNLILTIGALIASIAFLEKLTGNDLFAFIDAFDTRLVQDSNIYRADSVFTGPLQLGSYLILPLSLAIFRLKRDMSANWVYLLYITLLVMAVFLTYSRAAVLAFGVVALTAIYVNYRPTRAQLWTIGLSLSGLGLGLIALAFKSDFVSQLIFHSSSANILVGNSTIDHLVFIGQGLQVLAQQPLGLGIGQVGPASFYASRALITENYYLQIALEVGVVGFAVWIWLIREVFQRLRATERSDRVAWALLAAGLGYLLMNFFLHTWADMATIITWWALTGIVIGRQIKPLR